MPEYRHQLQIPAYVSEWCQQDWTHKDKHLAYSDVNEWVGLDGVKYMVTRVGLWKHETCLSLLQWSVVIHRCWVSDLDSLVTLLLNCRRCQPATSALLTLLWLTCWVMLPASVHKWSLDYVSPFTDTVSMPFTLPVLSASAIDQMFSKVHLLLTFPLLCIYLYVTDKHSYQNNYFCYCIYSYFI